VEIKGSQFEDALTLMSYFTEVKGGHSLKLTIYFQMGIMSFLLELKLSHYKTDISL